MSLLAWKNTGANSRDSADLVGVCVAWLVGGVGMLVNPEDYGIVIIHYENVMLKQAGCKTQCNS